MKFTWNKKYTTIAIYAAIVLLFGIFCVFFFINYSDFGKYTSLIGTTLRPLVYGIIMAYLIWPILKFFEDKVFAYITGDDKIPVQPEKPEIPDMPEKPEKPEKPTFDASATKDDKLMALELYAEALKAYRDKYREYSRALSARKKAVSKCKRIDKNAPRLDRKIARITARHIRISEKKRKDGTKKTNFMLRRALSTLCAVVVTIIFLGLFVYMIVPQVAEGYNELVTRMPGYIMTLSEWLRSLSERSDYLGNIVNGLVEYINNFLATISNLVTNLLPSIATILKNVLLTIKDILLGIFFAVYFLLGKERVIAKIKKLSRAIFKERAFNRLSKTCSDLNKNFGSFIAAKIIDSLIIGIITFFVMLVLGMPYYPLIAVIIGITNLIPIFGPVVGAVLGGFIVFITDPTKVILFIIVIIILQQFDGNFLGPRLMGTQTDTTSLGILAALTVFSSIWGVTGLIIAVPLFVVIYSLVKEKTEERLRKKGAPVNTSDFYDPDDKIGLSLHAEAELKKKRKMARQLIAVDETGQIEEPESESPAEIENGEPDP
ncbi:MAG: AI-2E family transporter, partial [Clostridia bacterium]|nr:AI-2E family transporter [Clostridia bacterium]